MKNGEKIFVRNPDAVRPWQHVLEPLSGYLLVGMLVDKDAVAFSGAYNFGPLPDDHVPVKDLVETAISCWGSGEWIDGYDATKSLTGTWSSGNGPKLYAPENATASLSAIIPTNK